ncbi:MAG TPA: hypothetical protein VGB73_04040, partial [Pyrinomonadaceae bacterium]
KSATDSARLLEASGLTVGRAAWPDFISGSSFLFGLFLHAQPGGSVAPQADVSNVYSSRIVAVEPGRVLRVQAQGSFG